VNDAVLLVDDKRENLVALEAILEPLEVDLVSVTSGADALKELLKRDFAAILLDVQMPGLDGFETAALIKQRERTRHVPIIFVTAISKADTHVFRGYSAGAVDYIFKPFNPDLLRAKVEAFVELHRRGAQLHAREEALRERELSEVRREEQQRYRELAEAMPQIVWVTDTDGNTTYCNRRWFEYTGFDPARPEDADWRQAVHPDDLAAAAKRRRETLESGEEFEAEYRFRRADGSYRWHLGRAVPVRNDNGEIDHWVGTATDIDEQQRRAGVERFLLQASTLLSGSLDYVETLRSLARLAVPSVADWCAIELVEDDGTVSAVEVAHADPRKSAVALELRDRYFPRHGPGPEVIRTGKPVLLSDITDDVLAHVAADELHAEILRDLGIRSCICVPMTVRDRVLGAITLVQAESERLYGDDDLALAEDLARRAAVAIENARLHRDVQERAQAARVLAAIGDGVILVDRSGLVRLWNPAATRITGVTSSEALGRRLSEAVPAFAAVEDGALGGGPTVLFELGGRERWLSISAETFDGGTVYALRDQTGERALEAMRQDLVATVSHELRTPLAAIYGAAITLQRADIDLQEELRERLLEIVVEESTRLSGIVDDLLLANQLDAGKLHLSIEECDASKLASSVVVAAQAHLPDGIAVELAAPGALPHVAADPGKLQQVFANLVDNAIKYSPGGGTVTVSLEARGDHVRFVVADPGIGIPAAEQRRIFEKFYRLDPDMTQGIGGTGLGLYICRELVRRAGGRIWVESQEGKGSTFYVELPVARTREPVAA
jgi:PAS domain S-box-containing protein